jgi:hypothetical protein
MNMKVVMLGAQERRAIELMLLAIGILGPMLTSGPVTAQTWTVLSPPGGGQQAGISSNGAVLVFGSEGYFEASTNAGQNWNTSGPQTPFFTSLACSGDGRIILASEAEGGGVCLWTNWPHYPPIRANLPGGVWTGTAACTTERLAACGTVGIFTSLDAGYTWTTNNPNPGWTNISMSADGQTLVGIHNSTIYVTTNFGGIWTQSSAPSNQWTQTACSFNGKRIYAAAIGGLYTSADAGLTWAATAAPALDWLSVACSYDGSKVVAGFGPNVAVSTGIFTSSDSGATWTSNNIPDPSGNSVACSADGNLVLAGGRAGNALQGVWAPSLRIVVSSGTLNFSWPAPSPGYILRQTSNLANPAWTTVTNTIQTTNFENQATIPLPPAASTFYELQNP